MSATENKEPITPELCHNSRLVFYPKDAEEATFIQKRLFEMECSWKRLGKTVAELEGCVQKGILCDNGTIYYNPDKDKPYFLCSIDQFDSEYIPADQKFIRDQFNELSGRIDDLAEKVNRIYEALYPDIDKTKPTLKKPRGTQTP